MLINYVLLALAIENYNIAVKALYNAFELVAVHKDKSRRYLVFSDLVEYNVLKIKILIAFFTIKSFKLYYIT